MDFTTAVATCMGQYARFDGRASRSEFWWFYLFTLLISWGASIVGALALGQFAGLLPIVANLVLLVPGIAVSARRLHDVGRSAKWLLLGFTVVGMIPLILWFAQESDPGANRFGEPLNIKMLDA